MDSQFPDLPTMRMPSVQPLPDLPTMPMPIAQPPRKRRKPWLVVVVIVGVLVVLGLGASLFGKVMGPANSPQASNTPQPASALTATSANQPTNAVTPAGTATQATATVTAAHQPKSTPTPPLSNVSHGRPRLGGPFSDFVGKYGPATPQGDANSQNFWADSAQTIDINVMKNDQGNVTQLNILGPRSWTTQQSISYCTLFLPDQAVQFYATGTLIKYHTSAGDVVLNVQSPSSCLLTFA